MIKTQSENVLNTLLVQLFSDILKIEEKSLRKGDFSDLSITEMHIIEAIGVYSIKTMSEIANKLSITVGTLTTAIKKLMNKGYVERRRTNQDRRVVLLELTKKGKLAFRIHEKFHDDMIKTVISGLSKEEEKILMLSLSKVNNFFNDKYHLIKN